MAEKKDSAKAKRKMSDWEEERRKKNREFVARYGDGVENRTRFWAVLDLMKIAYVMGCNASERAEEFEKTQTAKCPNDEGFIEPLSVGEQEAYEDMVAEMGETLEIQYDSVGEESGLTKEDYDQCCQLLDDLLFDMGDTRNVNYGESLLPALLMVLKK